MTMTSRLVSTVAASGLAVVLSMSVPASAQADAGTGSISGTLTSATGIPMADVGVSVHTLRGSAVSAPAHTDSAGRYTVAGLPPGTYRVQFWVERNTNSSWHQWAHQATQPARATKFAVAAGQDVIVDETRFRTGSLSLTLQDASGQPVDEFCADAIGDNVVETGCTGTGALVLEDLPAGDYMIFAWAGDMAGSGMTTTVAEEANHFVVTAF